MKSANWLIGALLVGGVAVGTFTWTARERHNAGVEGMPVASAHAATKHPRLGKRVDDPKSPAFQSWLGDVKEAQLREDEVLDLFDADLSGAQKNALLDAHLRELSLRGSFPAPERWSQRLTEAVLRSDLDLDLGHKAGRILGHVSSPRQLADLEAEYQRRGSTMSPGNKLAVVAASRNPEFVSSVLDDATEPLEVREAAIERVAEVGDPRRLEQIAAPDSKAEPTLKVASVGALAERAQTTAELTKAVDLARSEPEQDAFGRTALNVAQARASESEVDGKSTVLFEAWQTALAQLRGGAPTEAVLLQTLATGKAFSRALWTEANPQTAAQLIEDALAPAIASSLAAVGPGSEQVALLQALAEFASDYCQECAMRAPAACTSGGDRRITYQAELASDPAAARRDGASVLRAAPGELDCRARLVAQGQSCSRYGAAGHCLSRVE